MSECAVPNASFRLVYNSGITRKRSDMAEKDEKVPMDEESTGEMQARSSPVSPKHIIDAALVTEGDSSSTSSTSPDQTQNNEGSHCDENDSSGDQVSCSSDAPVVPLFSNHSTGSTSTARRRRTVKMVDITPLEAASHSSSVHEETNDGFHHFPSSMSSSSHSYVNFGGWVGTLPKSESHWGDSEEEDTDQKVGAAASLSPPSPPPMSLVTENEECSKNRDDEKYGEEDRKMSATDVRKNSTEMYEDDSDTEQFEDEYSDRKRKMREKESSTANENDASDSMERCAPVACAISQFDQGSVVTSASSTTQNLDQKCGAVRSKGDSSNNHNNVERDEDIKMQNKTPQSSTDPGRGINRDSKKRSYHLLAKYIASTGIDMDVATAMAAKFAADEKDNGESKREIADVERGENTRSYKDDYRSIYAQNDNGTYDRDLAMKRPTRSYEEAPNSANSSITSGEIDDDSPAPSLDAEETTNDERSASTPEPQPGAVHVSGRAAGQFPAWGRSSLQQPLSQPLQRPSAGSLSIATAASVAAAPTDGASQGDSHADEITLVEANLVTDDGSDIVFATAESMPHPLKLMWRDKRWRILLVILILISGIAVAIVFGAVLELNGTDEGEVQELQPTVSPTSRPTVNHDAIKEVLSPLSGEAVLNEIGSPQHSAMVWLANYDETSTDWGGMFFQRYAMAVLYFATTMDESTEWRVKDDWLNPTKHECDWGLGITCKRDLLGRNFVASINLENNGLSGVFPAELRLLDGLETLQLNNNALQGKIPETIGQMTKLELLDLGSNRLTGPIPDSIKNCTELHTLSLNQNSFDGGFDWLYELKELRAVDLSDNKFKTQMSKRISDLTRLITMKMERNLISGEVPGEAFAIPDLAYLHLDGNQLNGTLPSLSGFFARRVQITISNNQLTGTLPSVEVSTTSLSGMDLSLDFFRIQRLDLSGNLLKGPLPPFLFPSVTHFLLSHNQFTGPIPSAYGLAEGLSHIDLSHNLLNGTLPTTIGYPQNIKHIKLYGNQLSGKIPEEYGGFESLELLNLHQNAFSGEVPVGLLSLEKLVFLDLRECNITGKIPEAVGNLKSLVVLDLGMNELSGTIPNEIGHLTKLKTLRLDSNSITGTLPSSLGNMKDLEELVLDGNNIEESLPQEICDLFENGDLVNVFVDCKVECDCCETCTETGAGPMHGPLDDNFSP